MTGCKRLIAFLLVLCFMLFSTPISVFASTPTTDFVEVSVFNGETTEYYTAIYQNRDLYFSAEDYGKISNYTYSSGNGNHGYKLGAKMIVVQPQINEMLIPILNHSEKIADVIQLDGVDYISASYMLPWLNVNCDVEDGVFQIIPDGISVWQAIDGLDYHEYMFNIFEEIGDDFTSISGLVAMSVFDTVLHLRWDRLVPADGTLLGATEGNSLYDYKCYKAALMDIAKIDAFSTENAEKIIDVAVKTNNGIDKLEDILGLDEEKLQLDADNYLRELGAEEDVILMFYELSENWQSIREGISAYDQITKYIDVLSVLKAYELVIEADTEYREYIEWLSEKGTNNKLFDRALSETDKLLDEETGVIFSTYTDFGHQLLSDLPGAVITSIANNSMNDAVISACSSFKSSVFSSLGQYMAVAQVVYGLIFPVAGGFEGMAKAGVLESIQDYCWSLGNQLGKGELTPETISHMRQSYITALQASRINFEAHQDTMDVKLLGVIDVFGGEGLLDFQIDKIDEKVLMLIASKDATENDSTSGKRQYRDKLKELFTELHLYIPAGDTTEILTNWFNSEINQDEVEVAVLADVTWDGLAELITVTRDEDGGKITGCVYAVDQTGSVKKIEEIFGSDFHAGGYFEWYLKEQESGYSLIQETDAMWQGRGRLAISEYYLDDDGTRIPVNNASTSSQDTEVVTDAAMEQYEMEKSVILSSAHVLYCATAYPSTDLSNMDASMVLKAPENKSGPPAVLTTGYWYRYSMQSSDCEEFVFSEDGSTLTIQYRECVSGDYFFEPKLYNYSYDEALGTVSINGGKGYSLDCDSGYLWYELQENPTQPIKTAYIKHYSEKPDAATLLAESKAFLEFWKAQD